MLQCVLDPFLLEDPLTMTPDVYDYYLVLTDPWEDNVHATTLEHDLRLEAGLPPDFS